MHLGVHHPGFAALPEEGRAHVSYLLLDWLLGEDDVERWVGRVEPLTTVPGTPRTGSDVREAVAGLAASRDPDDWAIARWEGPDGSPGLALFRRGTRWVDHPVLDRHQVLTVGYDAQENGLPADGAVLDALRTLEDELEGLLGGRGILLAHESNRGTRTFHAYTDGEDQNVDALVQEWAARRGVGVGAGDDPAWTEVRHFTG